MNSPVYKLRPQRQSNIPNVVFALLIINGLVYALQHWLGPSFTYNFALWSLDHPAFRPWQLVTHGFLHDPRLLTHIAINMFMLWMFGREIEHLMGAQRFIIYYMTCVVGAGIMQLGFHAVMNISGSMVGASGGVFGLLLAYGMAFPNRRIMLLFPPIPMKAKYMVILFGLLELYMGVSGSAPGVANFAHLGGMVFGFFLLRHWSQSGRRG